MTDKVMRIDALLYIQIGTTLIGLAIATFALSADWLGMGGLPGLGVRQTLLAIAGAGLVALGITFFVCYRLYVLLDRWNTAVLQTTAAYIVFMVFSAGWYVAGIWQVSEEDEELQRRFKSLFEPHHMCYGFEARIGAEFLRQNGGFLN